MGNIKKRDYCDQKSDCFTAKERAPGYWRRFAMTTRSNKRGAEYEYL
jgi:hypothetical protein